jgi:hypothetical protein
MPDADDHRVNKKLSSIVAHTTLVLLLCLSASSACELEHTLDEKVNEKGNTKYRSRGQRV